ncbi:histidine ammonia-lyase [Sphingobacterium bovistauri]|uniref:Histidine ammonia-lyase n=1 Tax=Sphingobacterium bovistauri TaxID=2781959 RepID=A0ABS7Z6D1_9SPHI|nr:histidine ammonia-lyase [Sphingobacterium bovistauri]MCA5005568.1 histidine ammonia-lyase [Sphingobacterium bovistauri]
MKTFKYGEDFLKSSAAVGIARGEIQGVLTQETIDNINRSAEYVRKIVDRGNVVYGINTGFGPLCTTLIDAEDTKKLQENILMSHAVGMGEPIDTELAKLMLILKVDALAKGYSGVQLSTIERIMWHIDHDIIPVVPKQGSVGASGDLAPLSHLFLPLIGLGKVDYQNEIRNTAEVLAEFDLQGVDLGAKEGLALINGTQFMAAHAVKALVEMNRVLDTADLVATLMIEGLNGSIKPFFKELHQLRDYKGNSYVASKIFNLLSGSAILESHKNCSRVQDPYSLRCIPQVHGASRNAWLHLKEIIETEINSVTDNPIIINDELTISGGSFHGQPIALPMDYATLAVSEIGNVSDRRVYLSLEGETNGVPKLLMKVTGLNSGFMILQYTTAAIASENKGLCFPSSADSIPTSLGQEDHVSMGSISGRKLLQVIDNVDKILSIELLCAAQAKDFHSPLVSTPIIESLHEHIRKSIPHLEEDQPMQDILEKALEMVKSGELLKIADEVASQQEVNYKDTYADYFENF